MRNVRVLKTLDFPPFICFKCRVGNDTREFYIDLGIDSEYDGAIFLCNICMDDVANQTDLFITMAEHQKVIDKQNYQVESYRKLLEKVEIWSKAFQRLTDNNVHDFFDNLETILNGPRADNSDVTESYSEPANTDEYVDPNNLGPADFDPTVAKPILINFS